MNQVAIKFVRSFLVMFVLIGLYHISLYFFFEIKMGMFLTIFPAAVFAVVMTIVHFLTLKKKGYGFNDKPLFKTEWEKRRRLISIAKQQGWKTEEKEDEIIFTTRGSWLSFGEIIRIVRKADNSAVVVSDSLFSATIFDFGKNLDNIRSMKEGI